jgi:hypothetical protein
MKPTKQALHFLVNDIQAVSEFTPNAFYYEKVGVSLYRQYITDKEGNLINQEGGAGLVNWADIEDKPLTFPPSAHTHEISEVNQLSQELLNAKKNQVNTVRNVSGITLPVGTPVRVVGATGENPNVEVANATSNGVPDRFDNGKNIVFGITTQSINNNASGEVLYKGTLKEYNTTAFEVGDFLFVASTGTTLTTTPPQSPAYQICVGLVTKKAVDGEVCVNVVEPIHLNDITGINLSRATLADKQAIVFNGSEFVNRELDKTDVGLSNVDNTSDANKPVSTATQSALYDKVDKVAGKGLSDENYTLAEKNKLAGIEANAQVNTVTSVAGKTGAVTLNANDITETTEKFFNTTFVELDENNSTLRFDVLPGFMYGAVNNKSQVGAFSIDFTDAKIGAVCIIHCGTTEEPSLDDAVFAGGEFIPNDTVIYVTFLGNGITQYVYANPTSLINYSNSKVQTLGNISGSVTINLDNGDDIVATMTGAVEFTITKPSLQSNEVAFFRLELIGDQAFSFINITRSEDGELEAPEDATLPYVYAGRLSANGNLDIHLAQQSLTTV